MSEFDLKYPEGDENSEAVSRLVDMSGPMIDRQLGKIESLNDRLVTLSRTALLLLGVLISGLGIAGQEFIASIGRLPQVVLSFSALFLLAAASLGIRTTDPGGGFGQSDYLYRDAIKKNYSEQQLNWHTAVISGSHIGANSAAINALAKKIQMVRFLLSFGTGLLLVTSLVVISGNDLTIAVAVIGEALFVGLALHYWLGNIETERKEEERDAFPEFTES